MQVKLLRVLQESEFERVGGLRTIKVDVRLVAATNRDLIREIASGSFREDLYYRLNVVRLVLPPLRDRRDDIPQLVDHFLVRFNAKLKKQVKRLDAEAMSRLTAHGWPGNIRELENVIERTVLFCDRDEATVAALPEEFRPPIVAAPSPAPVARAPVPIVAVAAIPSEVPSSTLAPAAPPTPPPAEAEEPGESFEPGDEGGSTPLKEIVREAAERVERDLIVRALAETGGNVTKAARRLQISRKSLQTKMKEFGLREQPASDPEKP
jgi:two-component system, NtrC family, response regulator AtoC